MKTYKATDKVKYRSSFLKSVGWTTNVPDFGLVSSVDGDVVSIHWNGREESMPVRAENIMPFNEPDYSGM